MIPGYKCIVPCPLIRRAGSKRGGGLEIGGKKNNHEDFFFLLPAFPRWENCDEVQKFKSSIVKYFSLRFNNCWCKKKREKKGARSTKKKLSLIISKEFLNLFDQSTGFFIMAFFFFRLAPWWFLVISLAFHRKEVGVTFGGVVR